jgi:GT2 family glycosyltransferase
VNFNGGQKLLDCVESVQTFTDDFKCVVIDNGSSDGSAERLRALYEDVNMVQNRTNEGFASANNQGIHRARGKYVVLLNSDTKVTKDWLRELTRCVETDSRIGIATPKILRMDGRLDTTGHVFWFDEVDAANRGAGEEDSGQYDTRTELVTCDFACAIIKKELLDQLGLLDERIFFLHEDIDFCLRAKLAGWRVVYCPQSVVYHHRGGSTSERRFTVFLRKRQRYLVRIALKSYELQNIPPALGRKSRQLLVSLVGVLAGIKNNDFAYAGRKLREAESIAEAFFWNVWHLPVQERVKAQACRKVSDDEIKSLSILPGELNAR